MNDAPEVYYGPDGEIEINGVALEKVENAIMVLQNAGLDTSSVVMSLSFVLPNNEI